MTIKKQSPPSLTPNERKILMRFEAMLRQQIAAGMPTFEEMRTMEPDARAEKARDRVQVLVENDLQLERKASNILRKRHQNMLAAIESVREDKRNLYGNPAVRWWIEHAQRWAMVHNDATAREFFQLLAKATQAGVGRDKRMEKGFDSRGAEFVEYHVRRLRLAGWSYGRIAKYLNLSVDESQLRRWINRRERRT